MPLTVTADTPIAVFRIFIDYVASAGTQTSADLYRGLSATGPWEFLRSTELLGQQDYLVDNTAPLDTNVWYRTVANDGTTFITGPTMIVDGGFAGWLRDPGRPWADIEMFVCENPDPLCDPPDELAWVGFGDFEEDADVSFTEILNDDKPSDTWARRKSLRTVISLLSRTLAMRARVRQLFTAGGPLFLQLPDVYGWDDDFIQTPPGSTLTTIYKSRDQRRPLRVYSTPVRTVRRPLGPIQGAICSNWCDVNAAWPNYTAMTAAGGDWGDIAEGTTQC